MRGLGYRPDPPKLAGERADFDARSRVMAAAIPARSENRRLVTSVLDQGGLGSCVANAVLQAVRASHVRQGVDMPALGSRLMLYYLARAQLGETQVDGGTFIRLAFESLNRFGFAPETMWPYTDQGEQWRTKPGNEVFHAAHDQRSRAAVPTRYYRIYETGFDRVAVVKLALAAGYLVAFGSPVSLAFCRGELGTAPLGPFAESTWAGRHAQTIVDHEGDRFRVVNSWGTGFGDGGFWHARADFVAWDEFRDPWIVEAAPYYSGAA